MQLRPYQERAIAACRQKLKEGVRRLVLCAPTGAGKTVIFSDIVRRAVGNGRRALILAHRRELVDQAVEKLAAVGVEAGVILAGEAEDRSRAVQVASIQTLGARRKGVAFRLLPKADLVVVDEAHHAVSPTWKRVIDAYSDAVVIGATATPWRTDKRALADLFETHVLAATVAELIENGSLSPYDVRAYDAPDLHEVPITAGDFNQRKLSLACNTSVLVGGIVRDFMTYHGGRRALLFPVSIEHSLALVAELQANGIRAEHIDGDTPTDERKTIIAHLARGRVQVVSSVGCFTEGFDCLDEQTEILTANGWRGLGQVNVGDLVYSLNRETAAGELVRAERVVERLVANDERMVTLRSQHVNVRTTEGHEFHVKYRDPNRRGELSAKFITRTGAQLVERRSAYALPISTQVEFPGVPLTDDELRLIAWFMTDGGFERFDFCISQAKSHRDEIRDLLTRLGLDFDERVRKPGRGAFANAKPLHVFRIPKGNQTGKQARRGWVKYEPYLDKDVSPLLHGMTREQFRVFWAELLKGDGAKQGNKAGWLWCDRKAQADGYTALAVVRGFSASFSIQKTKAGRDMFVVSCRDAQWITSDPADPRAAKIAFDEPRAGERVWCVTNRNSTLITRREGKIAVVGNCPGVEICILARPTMSLTLHLQMCGRGLRPAPGKERALLVDHGGNFLRHGLPDDDRDYSLTATPKRVEELHRCPFCLQVFHRLGDDGSCPKCGEIIAPPREVREENARREKERIEGEIINAERIKQLRAEAAARDSAEKKRAYYERLVAEATNKRYKRSWVYVRFKLKYGHPPNFGKVA